FLAGGDHFDGVFQGHLALLQHAHAFEAGDDAEGAVEEAAGGHAVEVGANHQRLLSRLAVAADDVAGAVHAMREPEGVHLLAQPGARLHVLVTESLAVDAAVFAVIAEAANGIDVLLDTIETDVHGHFHIASACVFKGVSRGGRREDAEGRKGKREVARKGAGGPPLRSAGDALKVITYFSASLRAFSAPS